jgi:hypothetical protein
LPFACDQQHPKENGSFLRARAKAGKIDAANSQGLTNVLRRCLKRLVTLAYCWGMISAASTQRLVDRFELWSA